MKLGVHKNRKVTEPDFSGKLSFSKKLGKRVQKGPTRPKNRVFGLLCKIESLLFARNDLKWSVIWLVNFLRKSHILENSRSRDLGQKGPKKGQKEVLGLLRKIESLVFARNGLKWSVLWLADFYAQIPYLGKLLFSRFMSKSSRPIRSLDFSNYYIFWPFNCFL